jgi:hypothetical protein
MGLGQLGVLRDAGDFVLISEITDLSLLGHLQH